MGPKEILKFCLENGLLLDQEVLSLFSDVGDEESVKLVLEKIKTHTDQKIITKNVFDENKEQVNRVFSALPEKNQKKLEKLKIKLGLSIEISKEISPIVDISQPISNPKKIDASVQIDKQVLGGFEGVRVTPSDLKQVNKLEVANFVKHFRNRFYDAKAVLEEHAELDNLVSIGKLSGNRQGVSLIGMVSDKRVTKNNNLLFDIEDLTGKIVVLVNQNKPDLYKKAEEIALDSVVGFRGSGSREIFFVNDIVFPEAVLFDRKKSPVEEYALFTGDLHLGSKKFLENSFLKFIDYLNGKLPNTPEVDKIKYLFLGGDIVTGIGNYPNQERDLKIDDLEEQFSSLAELLGKIKSNLKIIISPGNHDGVRLMEPQPVLDEKYAWPLYNLKNVIFTENPARVNIGAKKNFSGFDVLTYHGFSFAYYANNISKLMLSGGMNVPDKIMEFLLRNRHLAPTHGSAQYYPSEKDSHFIKDIPDILFTGHAHKNTVSYYNNVLTISSSCWEALTPYQEKFGNTPDYCKVPLFNLKSRAVKILDFEEDEY